jgi:hypothetical protein
MTLPATTWNLGMITFAVFCFNVIGKFIGYQEGVRSIDVVTILCIFYIGTVLSTQIGEKVTR